MIDAVSDTLNLFKSSQSHLNITFISIMNKMKLKSFQLI
ncbi:hypothetical protein ACJ72_08200 [Emergomyces africanus]|uniref:Uncharacterized protein n=1 Tax=Emergomyces africanus TaxID=1955775 RepID=A0A1B7NKY1_9EURO|nr:hypothetical protein ACJ72_08200 [Emergomyces africanus]